MNFYTEINLLKDRIKCLEELINQKEKDNASINSVDNKDILDRENIKASTSSSGRLPSKKLKKQTGRQVVGKGKNDTGKKISAKADI